MGHLQHSRIIPFAVDQVFAYVADFNNLPFMLQPYIGVKVLAAPVMRRGADYAFAMTRMGVTRQCVFRIEEFQRNQSFADRQIEGVFARWYHVQKFSPHDRDQTLLMDYIDYTLPYGVLGRLADDLFSRFDLAEIVEARYERIIEGLRVLSRQDPAQN